MTTKIKTYKGIDIYYNEKNGRLTFGFEGQEREAKYLFEAQQIIDEPVWESCNLEGYFVDGTFHDFIGKAKAERKDIKNKKPDWLYNGKYDNGYKRPNMGGEKVFIKSKENDEVYKMFLEQKDVVKKEEIKLKNIIAKLK